MGSFTSRLVQEGDIPAYIQRDDDYCCGILAQADEPGSFNQPKPAQLSDLSDDHWASLKLRIDPVARKILDPHRSMFLAGILILLLWSVFRVVKPNLAALEAKYEGKFYDDDYYYYNTNTNNNNYMEAYYDNNGNANSYSDNETFQEWLESSGQAYDGAQDQNNSGDNNNSNSGDNNNSDAENEWYEAQYQNYVNNMRSEVKREYMYRLVEMEHDLVYWNITFSVMVLALVGVTVHLGYGMLRRNSYYDAQLQQICLGEIRQRFQSEGFDIAYRTNHAMTMTRMGDCVWNMIWRPKRVIVFTQFTTSCSPPNSPKRHAMRMAHQYHPNTSTSLHNTHTWTPPESADGHHNGHRRLTPRPISTALYNPPSFVMNSPMNYNSPATNFAGVAAGGGGAVNHNYNHDAPTTQSSCSSPRSDFRMV
jgi:hypothetical protein